MFNKTLPTIIEKGISITPLLNSNIFNYHFDFDEWPSQHTNDNKYLRPYNFSIFDVRNHYETVFFEDKFKYSQDEGSNTDSSKVFKIKYTLSLLPSFGERIESGDG